VQVPASLSIHGYSFSLEAFTIFQYTGAFMLSCWEF